MFLLVKFKVCNLKGGIMGGGTYSMSARSLSGRDDYYKGASPTEIFKQKTINSSMNPYGVKIRESRDSIEHPNSLAIVLALDVTGSMGSVPHHLVKEGLPNIMEGIIQAGIKDPQLLFLGIGDHTCDSFPLQVSQFESSDSLLDKWLTDTYLEGGGGGNDGESYLLAWYFAGKHTSIDCFEKRKQKGFLFTIGDEPILKEISIGVLKDIMGDGQYENYTAVKLLDEARKKYEVYHINIKETSSGSRQKVIDDWKQLMGDKLIVAERHEDVSKIITDIVSKKSEVILKGNKKKEETKTEEVML
jgi:hypothetical protein